MRNEQPNFNFEGLSYNDPQHIEDAVVFGERGASTEELHQNEDGTFTNETGDVFEKEGETYKLKAKYSPDFLEALEKARKDFPNERETFHEAQARSELRKRNAAAMREALDALRKKEK